MKLINQEIHQPLMIRHFQDHKNHNQKAMIVISKKI